MSKDVPYTLQFLSIKVLDIGLVSVYFFVIGIAFAKLFDYIYGDFHKEQYKKHTKLRLFLEIVSHLFLLGVVAYFLRNIVERIPFPLDGVAGFEHSRLKELEGGHVIAIVMILFQKNLQNKIAYFVETMFGIKVQPE